MFNTENQKISGHGFHLVLVEEESIPLIFLCPGPGSESIPPLLSLMVHDCMDLFSPITHHFIILNV